LKELVNSELLESGVVENFEREKWRILRILGSTTKCRERRRWGPVFRPDDRIQVGRDRARRECAGLEFGDDCNIRNQFRGSDVVRGFLLRVWLGARKDADALAGGRLGADLLFFVEVDRVGEWPHGPRRSPSGEQDLLLLARGSRSKDPLADLRNLDRVLGETFAKALRLRASRLHNSLVRKEALAGLGKAICHHNAPEIRYDG
jgi:hypothetical protein